MKISNLKLLAVLIIFLPIFSLLKAEEKAFPSWMDEVDFKRPNSTMDFNEPTAPIDPETGRRSTMKSSYKNKFNFKPNLPDFKELRKKAMKSSVEKSASDTESLKTTAKVDLKSLPKYKNHLNKLEEQLQRSASPYMIKRLENQKKQTALKIQILEEMANIVKLDKGIGQIDLTSLSPQKQRRFEELTGMFFGVGKQIKYKELKPIKSQDTNNLTTNHKTPSRFYRPGKFKSFFKQSKEDKENSLEQD